MHINYQPQNVWQLSPVQKCFHETHFIRPQQKSNATAEGTSQIEDCIISQATEIVFTEEKC